jgi:hypothetical protein
MPGAVFPGLHPGYASIAEEDLDYPWMAIMFCLIANYFRMALD